MKPPSRKRSVPLRFVSKEPELKRRAKVRAGWFGWKWNERRVLLVELKRQRRNAELNLVALQAKLPKRSIQQIESFVQFLKTVLGKRVTRLVNRSRPDKQSDKVPIELWTEMAEKMASSQETAISSAFSQMLVIAATEPCSLLNSVPPHSISTPRPLPSNFQKIPLRPMTRPPVTTSSTCISPMGHTSTQLSSSLTSESPSVECEKGSLLSLEPEASPSVANLPSRSQSTLPNVAAPTLPGNAEHKGGTIYSNSPNPASPLPNHVPESQSSYKPGAITSKSSQPAEQAAGPGTRISTQGLEHSSSSPSPISDQPTNLKTLKHTDVGVDFENIYRFLSSMNKQVNAPTLSPMESAVVLDLLLSLPEQIPLLNCVELQRHLRQVHEHLSAPAKDPPLPTGIGQDPCSHHAPSGGETQTEMSTVQEGPLDPPVSSVPNVHTGSIVSGASIESPAFCSSETGETAALPQATDSQETNCSGQADKETPVDPNNRVEYTSQSQGSAILSVSSSEPEAGFQPKSMARTGMPGPTVPDIPAIESPLQLQTEQQSTSKSNCETVPTHSQNIEQEKAFFEKAGLCPLNPFIIPLKLLVRSQPPLFEG